MPCLLLRLNLLSGRDTQQLALRLAGQSRKAARHRRWNRRQGGSDGSAGSRKAVEAVDGIDRFCAGLSVKTARYLSTHEWRDVTEQSGWPISAVATEQPYRSGVHAMLFPNRLETTMRLDPIRD